MNLHRLGRSLDHRSRYTCRRQSDCCNNYAGLWNDSKGIAAIGRKMRRLIPRLFLNIRAAYLTCAVNFSCTLVAVPIYVRFLGKEEYGLWLAILSVLMPLTLMDLGFSTVSQNKLAEARASDRGDEINRIIITSFVFLVVTALTACLLALVGLRLGVIRHLLKTSPEIERTVAPALLIVLAGLAFSQPFQVFRLGLRAFQRVDFEQYVVALLSILNVLLATVALWSGHGIIGVSVVFALLQLVGGIISFAVLARTFPGMRFALRFFSWGLLQDMARPGFHFFVISCAGLMIWGIDNLVISAVMGVASLAPFAIAQRLTSAVQGMIGVPFNTSKPTMTALNAEGNEGSLKRLFALTTKLALSAAILCTIELASFGRSFIALWAGRSVLLDRNTFIALVAVLTVDVLQQPSFTMIIATTRHQIYSRLIVGEAIANLALSWWWVHRWGVLGVALGTLVPHALIAGSYVLVAGMRMNGLTFSELWGRHILALLLPSAVTIAVGFFLRNFSTTWLQWTISVGLTLVSFVSAYWLASITQEERGVLAAAFRLA